MSARSFWRLCSPDSTRKCAEWDDDAMDLEQVICPINKHHRRGGKRLTDLNVTLPRGTVQDFVWTWYSECLIQDRVLQLFREHKFTGFEVRPVTARFKDPNANDPPTLWELVLTGWAGLARPESGIRRVEYCEACRHVVYTGLNAPDMLLDDAQWDGSDFFMIWPMPTHVFVAERVIKLIRKEKLSGITIKASSELEPTDGYGPGRLSHWMPEARARDLGKAWRIEEV